MRLLTLPALVAVVLSPLAFVAPAHGANEVTVTMPGGVLYDSCGDYPMSYAASLPAGYGPYWNMDLQVLGPDGNEVSSSYIYGESATGTETAFLCESPNLAGTYTIRGTGEACNRSFNCTPITAVPTTVTFRLPQTRTSVTAKPRKPVDGEVVRFAVRSTDERPTGYFGTSYADVRLQVRRGGSWRTISKTSTGETGRAVLKARYTGRRVATRVVTDGNSDRTGSVSRTIWIG